MVVYRLQKVFGKSGSKVNGTWLVLVVPAENVREQRNIWKGIVLFFRTEYSKPKFAFYFSKPSLIPVSSLRGHFPESNWFAQMVNEIPGRSKFTSPEFCVPFALTVDRPVFPDGNGKQPMWMRSSLAGTAIICERKCISLSFFYYNILHESHRYN